MGMGPKYIGQTCCRIFSGIQKFWRRKRPPKRAKVPNLAQAAKLEPFAPHEKEMRDIHPFNICPKASHGSQIHWTNMLQNIQWHPKILEGQTSSEQEGQSAKSGPGSQIGALCPLEKEAKAIHSFNICPKAPHGSPMQCCNRQRRIHLHPNILEE